MTLASHKCVPSCRVAVDHWVQSRDGRLAWRERDEGDSGEARRWVGSTSLRFGCPQGEGEQSACQILILTAVKKVLFSLTAAPTARSRFGPSCPSIPIGLGVRYRDSINSTLSAKHVLQTPHCGGATFMQAAAKKSTFEKARFRSRIACSEPVDHEDVLNSH
jgi:hypothetical protein